MITSPPELNWARQRLFGALKGHWAELAQSRFACWGVEKMFGVMDLNKKARGYISIFLHVYRTVFCRATPCM